MEVGGWHEQADVGSGGGEYPRWGGGHKASGDLDEAFRALGKKKVFVYNRVEKAAATGPFSIFAAC